MTSRVLRALPAHLRPACWLGRYRSVLPHVRAIIERSCDEAVAVAQAAPATRAMLRTCLARLCDPNPRSRAAWSPADVPRWFATAGIAA